MKDPKDPQRQALALTTDQEQELSRAVTVAERTELIFEWMARGYYLPGSDRTLAALWQVDRATVRKYAAESCRRLMRELVGKSRDQLLTELLVRIQSIGQAALERTEETVTADGDVVEVRRPDMRTALRSAEAMGELLGLRVQRHHHTHGAEQLTEAQIIEQLRQHGVRVELPEGTDAVDVDEGISGGQRRRLDS